MLVLTGATGKITAVTVWEENIVTTQKMHLFTGGGTDFAVKRAASCIEPQQELEQT